MELAHDTPITVEHIEPLQRHLRIAVVTETWPPEINGVAVTLSRLIQQLGSRHHTIQLIRPRQDKLDAGKENEGWSELLLKGLPIPKYPQLKLGLPSKKALLKAWILNGEKNSFYKEIIDGYNNSPTNAAIISSYSL